MRARLVWTAVALLVAGAAHVRGLCCTGGVAKGSINCPNPFYMSDKCENGYIRVERRTFNEPNGSTRRDMVNLDCTAPIIVQERVTAKGYCADGSYPSWKDHCTDVNRPILDKDGKPPQEGWTGRCDVFGCNCGWECLEGPLNPDQPDIHYYCDTYLVPTFWNG
jgi:hypothetical protein